MAPEQVLPDLVPVCRMGSGPEILTLTVASAHNASVKCDRMRSQKLRRRPDSCHAFHPEVRVKAGGGWAESSPPRPLCLGLCPEDRNMPMNTPVPVLSGGNICVYALRRWDIIRNRYLVPVLVPGKLLKPLLFPE